MAEFYDIRAVLDEACNTLFGKPNGVATGAGFKVSQGVRMATLSSVCSVVEKPPLAAPSAGEVVPYECAARAHKTCAASWRRTPPWSWPRSTPARLRTLSKP